MATKPAIAIIPSGYKASTLYSVLPSDGVGDFDFSRSGQATRVNKDGLIETVGSNIPRLNYPMIDGVVSGCPSLLLEPQSTNLITNSQDINASSWYKQNLTVNTDNTISPAATQTADKVLENNVDSSHLFYQEVAANGNDTYNFSVFVKKLNRRYVGIQGFYNNVRGSIAFYDLDEGILVYTNQFGSGYSINDAKIEEYSDGWYRLSANITSPDSIHYLGLCLADDNWGSGTAYTNTYQGDVTKGVYIWGAQVEQGSYPTSYIPTNGGTVTRSAETCNGAGDANTFNDSEGVLMAEISALANDSTYKIISVSNPTSSNRVSVFYGNASDVIRIQVLKDGVAQIDQSTSSYDITQYNKIALKYKQNDFVLWINGIKVLTYNLGDTPIGLIKLNFDEGEGSNDFYGNVKQIQYFDTALSDEELSLLTSL